MKVSKNFPKYILITAARNEEAYISLTLNTIINQTVKPEKWIIVDDGSTDKTANIVLEYQQQHSFIKFITTKRKSERSFASKVYAIQAGFDQLGDIQYQFYGNLDADVSFAENYYESILIRFLDHPQLGVAGGVIYDLIDGTFQRQPANPRSVGGPIQFFHRECYEQIGGFLPLIRGMEDGVAEIMARQHGWLTQSYPNLKVYHHRREGTAKQSIYMMRFNTGINQYQLGYLFIYQFARSLAFTRHKPYIIGGLNMLAGYIYAWIRRKKSIVPDNFIGYLRQEQKAFLIAIVKTSLRLKSEFQDTKKNIYL